MSPVRQRPSLVPSACGLQETVNKLDDSVKKKGMKVNFGKPKVTSHNPIPSRRTRAARSQGSRSSGRSLALRISPIPPIFYWRTAHWHLMFKNVRAP
ncbi:hypothetical protein EVAR_93358_1 [Eumeta japonica]|uniref:Uncharacterized protein n=1 Tax=Eumeta variegata TaxID=151549 RepID=A0A4C1USW8_EUMVA|nr:hypothetical protein EVAR_93358_1 [Eumeta japonica]